MDNFEIDKLFGTTSGKILPSHDFKREALKKSTVALKEGYRLQRQLKISGVTLGIFLITCGSLICGHFLTSKRQEDDRISTKSYASAYIHKLEQIINAKKEKSFWQTKAIASLHPKYVDYENRIQTLNILENYKKFTKGNYHE